MASPSGSAPSPSLKDPRFSNKTGRHDTNEHLISEVASSRSSKCDDDDGEAEAHFETKLTPEERALRRKIDWRLCTIAGILTSLDLLDSGIISSAAVTSMFKDLDLGVGNRYSVSIFIFTVSSIAFQLPATILVRTLGPRIFFATSTFLFGLITLCTAFITSWRQMIALRVLLGISMAGIYPGLTYLISTWYTRREQQLRFAFLQSGEVFVLASGSILNYGLAQLDGRSGLASWRWMFLVQGALAMVVGIVTYWWIVEFPERNDRSFRFLTPAETALAVQRIDHDRQDVHAAPFSWNTLLRHALDIKIYAFAVMFFLLNLVSTALAYFLPIILENGMGFSPTMSIVLSAPPYYYAIIPALLSAWAGDHFHARGPVIIVNSCCLILGIGLLGFSTNVAARYVGTFLATGAYISNWAALSAFYTSNIAGQWKRVLTAAIVTAFNGAGGIAGSFIFIQTEAPRYLTAIWVSIGSHIGLIACVIAFSWAFRIANQRVERGGRLIEGIRGFRHSY